MVVNINKMIDKGHVIERIPTKIALAYTRQINHILRSEIRWGIYRPNRIFFSQLPKASILR
jgi:hypothetical protein